MIHVWIPVWKVTGRFIEIRSCPIRLCGSLVSQIASFIDEAWDWAVSDKQLQQQVGIFKTAFREWFKSVWHCIWVWLIIGDNTTNMPLFFKHSRCIGVRHVSDVSGNTDKSGHLKQKVSRPHWEKQSVKNPKLLAGSPDPYLFLDTILHNEQLKGMLMEMQKIWIVILKLFIWDPN